MWTDENEVFEYDHDVIARGQLSPVFVNEVNMNTAINTKRELAPNCNVQFHELLALRMLCKGIYTVGFIKRTTALHPSSYRTDDLSLE